MTHCFPDEDAFKDSHAAVTWLRKHTGLTEVRAKECLSENDGSLVRALCSFAQTRRALPSDYISNEYTIPINTVNEILFEAYCRVFQLQKQSGEAEHICWGTLSKCNWEVNNALMILNPSRTIGSGNPQAKAEAQNGPLLRSAYFVENEILCRAPLFGHHSEDWLQRNTESLITRTSKWVECAGRLYSSPLALKEIPLEEAGKEIPRIIWQDCVRTFFDDLHRKRLATFLYSLYLEQGSYGQAMSYFAGILLLTMGEQDAAKIMRKVNKEYIPGHWAAEAVGFATNAFVWDFLLKDVEPAIHTHFTSIAFMPDTYLQKLFNGLSIHVLEFDLMYDYIERFLSEGFPWMLKFATSLAITVKPRLLKLQQKDVSELYALMRMDKGQLARKEILSIFEMASSTKFDSYLTKVDDWRMRAYNEKIEPRLKKAPKENAFEPCHVCEVACPSLFCDDCGPVCDACHASARANGKIVSKDGTFSHLGTHDVDSW